MLISTNVDLNGYVPIHDSWEGIAYLGVGFARYKPKFTVTSGAGFDTLHNIKAKTKAYFRFGAGVQGLITDTVGVRF